jgi:hypothetical protein
MNIRPSTNVQTNTTPRINTVARKPGQPATPAATPATTPIAPAAPGAAPSGSPLGGTIDTTA